MSLPLSAFGIEHEDEAERQCGDLLYYARKTFPGFFAPSAQQVRVFKLWSLLLRAKMKRKWNVDHPNDPVDLSPEEQAVVHKIGLSIQSGHGCHAAGTPILLYDGTVKRVEEVTTKDVLMGDDGTPRRVLRLARGREQIFRVRYKNGECYTVNGSHKLCLVATNSKGRRKAGDIQEVPVWDYLRWGKDKKRCWVGYKASVPQFEGGKPLRIAPYILGLWLGDGNQSTSQIFNIDHEIIEAWRDEGTRRGLTSSCRLGKEHSLRNPKRTGNSFISDLDYYSLRGNKHIPLDYVRASLDDRLALLAGLLDTDGTLDQRGRRVFTIIQKRRQLAQDVVFLARSVGCHASLREKSKSWTWNGKRFEAQYYEVSITRNIERIPVRIPRKRPSSCIQRPNLHFGFAVEPLQEDEYYGFELDGNHRYLLGDFTVTRNTGKDCFSVIAGLHFLQCFAESRVMVTAPAGPQLFTVIWPEFDVWIHRSPVLKSLVEINSNSISFIGDPTANHHFIEPRTINPNAPDETKGQVLAGLHGPYILRIIDEASAVPDAVMTPFEGGLTDPVSLIIVIFNPTRTTGFAIETQRRDRDRWICAHWDAEELRINPPRWVDITQQYELERKYGRDSNFYRIRVRGLPAHESPDTLISWEWLMDAVERQPSYLPTDPLLFGVDVAGEGTDRTVIAVRRRDDILALHETRGLNTNHVAWWVEEILLSYLDDEPDLSYYVAVDTINVGKHVYDYLTEIKHYKSVYPINVAERAAANRRFHRLRDEVWWDVRMAFETGVMSIPNDDGLISELNAIKLDPNRIDDLVKILSKKKMQSELPSGITSPDKADAVMHTQFLRRRYAPSGTMTPERIDRRFSRFRRRSPYGPRSWKTL